MHSSEYFVIIGTSTFISQLNIMKLHNLYMFTKYAILSTIQQSS